LIKVVFERMCENFRKWMCEDLRGKYEKSECVWIEVCQSRFVRKVYWSL